MSTPTAVADAQTRSFLEQPQPPAAWRPRRPDAAPRAHRRDPRCAGAGQAVVLRPDGDRLHVLLGDRRLTMPARVTDAVERARSLDDVHPRRPRRWTRSRAWCSSAAWSARDCSRSSADATGPVTSAARPPPSARLDDLAGTATHLTALPARSSTTGPGGASALADSRLPEEVKRTSLRHRTSRCCWPAGTSGPTGSRLPGVRRFPARRLLLGTTLRDHAELLDLDLDAIARGEAPDWDRFEGPLFGVCTHGRHDACCAERGRPVAAALTDVAPERDLGGLARRRRPVRRQRAGAARGSLLRPDGSRVGQPGGDAARGRTGRHRPAARAARRTRCTCSTPRSRCAATSRRTASTPSGWSVGRGRPACSRCRDIDWAVTVRRESRGEGRLTCGVERLNPLPAHEVVSLRADLRQHCACLRQLPMSRWLP